MPQCNGRWHSLNNITRGKQIQPKQYNITQKTDQPVPKLQIQRIPLHNLSGEKKKKKKEVIIWDHTLA